MCEGVAPTLAAAGAPDETNEGRGGAPDEGLRQRAWSGLFGNGLLTAARPGLEGLEGLTHLGWTLMIDPGWTWQVTFPMINMGRWWPGLHLPTPESLSDDAGSSSPVSHASN